PLAGAVAVPVAIEGRRRLRSGDLVRVRDADAILATLDGSGRLDGLPFMPEMWRYIGRTLVVDAVVHRTCDTVKTGGTSGTTRAMPRVVHLAGLRCDGSAHGGCQARCLVYWKEAWLERVPAGRVVAAAAAPPSTPPPDELLEAARGEGSTTEDPVWSCQATDLLDASTFVSARHPRPWLADIASGNARPRDTVRSLAVLLFNKWQSLSRRLPRPLRIHDGQSWPWFTPTGERRRHGELGLEPGDLVEVRSQAEIEATLDDRGAVRGLRFSAEMLPYCGTRARVLGRVERIIDEKTGRMLSLRDCIVLDGVWCEGTYRALCRRKIYTYWRETWLRPVDEPSGGPVDGRGGRGGRRYPRERSAGGAGTSHPTAEQDHHE
ncbi:MAG TPA: hypothetical protein VJM49_17015, partial [Acidimicrobiales bacterium]|nr:hypothetical protein [Acidimicrobiales bacterium]